MTIDGGVHQNIMAASTQKRQPFIDNVRVAADLDKTFGSVEFVDILGIARPLTKTEMQGVNVFWFPNEETRPIEQGRFAIRTLMPKGYDTVDLFVTTTGPPNTAVVPAVIASSVGPTIGLAIAYNRDLTHLLREGVSDG